MQAMRRKMGLGSDIGVQEKEPDERGDPDRVPSAFTSIGQLEKI